MKITIYSTKTGKSPFLDWLQDLDRKSKAIIRSRIDRLSLGNFGDSKSLRGGEGVKELRIAYGPGYRVYYGTKGTTLIILLLGGDKGSQNRDIQKAKRYWLECKEL